MGSRNSTTETQRRREVQNIIRACPASKFRSRTMHSMAYLILSLCLCASVVNSVQAQGLPDAPPQTVGMNAAKLNQIDALVNADIADKKLPGAVVIVGHKGKIVYRKAFGNRS